VINLIISRNHSREFTQKMEYGKQDKKILRNTEKCKIYIFFFWWCSSSVFFILFSNTNIWTFFTFIGEAKWRY